MRTTMFMCAVLAWSGVANAIVVLNDGRDDYQLNNSVFSNETIEVRDSSSGDGTTLTVLSGTYAARQIDVFGSSYVEVVGGEIGSGLSLRDNSTGRIIGGRVFGSVTISGSATLQDLSNADVRTLQIEDSGRAVVNSTNIVGSWGPQALRITGSGHGSQVDIFGGHIGDITLHDNAVVNLHGGVLAPGDDWRLYDTATLNVYGTSFNHPFGPITTRIGDNITGVLSDGTAFSNQPYGFFSPGANINLIDPSAVPSPEPSTLLLFGAVALGMFRPRRRQA